MKKLFFVSGMPRSGSTVLMNILGQNPNFHVTPTSGLCEVLVQNRNMWDNFVEHKAYIGKTSEIKKRNTLRGIIESYYTEVDNPIIIDKSRGWLAHIELLIWLLGEDIKILVPVRDMRDILASWELIWRKTSMKSQMMVESQNYLKMQTLADRLKVYTEGSQPIGLAFNRIKDAKTRGHNFHLVSYEKLTSNPQQTLDDIYKYLNVENFTHDFNNIVQITQEDDTVHGIEGLHSIRSKLEPSVPKWSYVLGDLGNNYYVDWKQL